MNGIRGHVDFSVCLLALTIISLQFIQIIAGVSTSFSPRGWVAFHCMHMPHFTYALIHLWTLGLCQPFGYYDKAVINIYIQVLCGYMLLFLLAIYLGVLLSHMIHLFDCMKNFQTFQSDFSIHISTSRVWGFQFLRIPINTGYYWIFFVLTIVTAACN